MCSTRRSSSEPPPPLRKSTCPDEVNRGTGSSGILRTVSFFEKYEQLRTINAELKLLYAPSDSLRANAPPDDLFIKRVIKPGRTPCERGYKSKRRSLVNYRELWNRGPNKIPPLLVCTTVCTDKTDSSSLALDGSRVMTHINVLPYCHVYKVSVPWIDDRDILCDSE